jgi:hypothetical protein
MTIQYSLINTPVCHTDEESDRASSSSYEESELDSMEVVSSDDLEYVDHKAAGKKHYIGKLLKSKQHKTKRLREIKTKIAEIQAHLDETLAIDTRYKSLKKKLQPLHFKANQLSRELTQQKGKLRALH